MKKFPLRLFFFALILLLNYNNGYSQNKPYIDYGGLNMARQAVNDKNYILAYKYLIIFKYTNLQRLKSNENTDCLAKLNNQIDQIEEYLLQNYSLLDVKKIRGFSETQIDSTFKARSQKIIIQNVIIN
ncbi:hypothetical protein [Mucilaginibacter gotjawali]|uniref:Uncharacterized protein n=2 Tax=Mucilaginibacter gotjawali TaxID=1550579 RepID=A0A110B252_9SPHI|nr:hypothetical protein [Mucilaginibacter gotjawali]MBB3055456.1 hypothetical protein [Mucilaginibacter gotjawali]BAU53264.1 hypothetical protein MgSA37_01431 [Mucilaginibacter gotjawali]